MIPQHIHAGRRAIATAALASSAMALDSPQVLFLAPVEPWARENGSSVVISDLLEGLAATRPDSLFPVFLRRSPAADAPPAPTGLRPVTVGAGTLPKWLSLASAALTGRSPWETRIRNHHVARLICATSRQRAFVPTVVHVEHLPLLRIGKYIAREFGCPLVYRAHNVESILWRRRLASGGPAMRWAMRRAERHETRAISAAQLTLCISDVDVAWARSSAPDARVELLPPALFLPRYRPFLSNAVVERQICFVGGLDWGPNEHGLRWFIDTVLPLVRASVPDVRLAILSRGASERAWIARNPSVIIVPSEQSALSLFSSSCASLAPLLQGGGVRIKILESLAVGCPVVATRIGGEGLDLPGLTHADDPRELAAACIRHLRTVPDPGTRQSMHESIRVEHGAVEVAEKLIGFWSALDVAAVPSISS